jgi:ABC-2 type transport system permease protein
LENSKKETGCTGGIILKINQESGLYNNFKLFFYYSILNLKTALEYKFDRLLIALAVFFREMTSVIIMVLLLTRFVSIKGWQMNEMLFLYSFLFLSYSFVVLFFTGIRDFEDLVYSGELDRFILRPIGIIFQVISSKVDYCAAIGHGTVGVILLIKTSRTLNIVWSADQIIYFVIIIIGGAVIQASIFMFSSLFSFWTIKTTGIRNLLFFNSRKISAYPLSFYPKLIQYILTFIIPFAFVNYFPTAYFLHKPEMNQFAKIFFYLNPFVACLLFGAAYAMWKKGLKRYSSCGNSQY